MENNWFEDVWEAFERECEKELFCNETLVKPIPVRPTTIKIRYY